MFKKTMKFDDLEGKEVEGTFYFHYDKKEVAELMEFGYISKFRPDDISSRLPLEEQLKVLSTPVSESGLSQKENTQQAYDIFQDLILDAFGEKGSDNQTFVKNERTREYFASHVAFPELIFEMIDNPRLAGSFIENCLPPKYREEAKKELESQGYSGATLHDMVEEAERRQKDPATRIEPGIEAAREALGHQPEIEQAAGAIKDSPDIASYEPPAKNRLASSLTAEDIEEMDANAFQRLDMKDLNKDALFAAFKRKEKNR